MQTLGELLRSPLFLGLVAAALVVGCCVLIGAYYLCKVIKQLKPDGRLAHAIDHLSEVLPTGVTQREFHDVTRGMSWDLREEMASLGEALGVEPVGPKEWVPRQRAQAPSHSEPQPPHEYQQPRQRQSNATDETRLLGQAALDMRTGCIREEGKRYAEPPFDVNLPVEVLACDEVASQALWKLLTHHKNQQGGRNARLWEPHPNGAGSWYTMLCSTVMREEYGYMPHFVIQMQFLWLVDDDNYKAWKAQQNPQR